MNKSLKIALAAGTFLLQPAIAFAGNSGLLLPTSITQGFSITSVGEFIAAVLRLLFVIAGVLVFVYLVWGGLQWLTSGGDSGSTQKARERITAALVGLAIIAVAWAITIVIQSFFGVSVTGNTIPLPYAGGA